MLTKVLEKLSAGKAPKIFAKVGTERIVIIRDSRAINEFGGEEVSADDVTVPIPAVLNTKQGNKRILGQEYLDARLMFACIHRGQVINLVETDKIKVLARPGANPERLYQVKDIQNIHGVYYDVGVVTE